MMEGPAPKRMRSEEGALVVAPDNLPTTSGIVGGRSSSLPAPTLKLSGHTGSVYSLQYSPNGCTLCSTSFDKTCLLWIHKDSDEYILENDETNNVANNNTATYYNFNVLQSHKNAVLDCSWCDNDCVVTASADKTVMLWDTSTGNRLRKYAEHTAIVNAVTSLKDTTQIVSASDDTSCLLWDRRQKRPTGKLESKYPILSVTGTSAQIFTSGIDPKIYCWDIRKIEHPYYSMSGHTDTVTCLSIHPEESFVLSNSMDGTIKSWDIRPFCQNKRLSKTFTGHTHNAEKGLLKCSWSADGSMVSGGSSDHRVHIWDVHSTEELYDLPGHTGCVNTVAFHPIETTVIASGGSDKVIYVGELS